MRHVASAPFRRLLRAAAGVLLVACGKGAEAPTTTVGPSLPPIALQTATQKLPRLEITTTARQPVISKDVYVTGTASLVDTSGAAQVLGALEIKGRGNSTWDLFPKKPYRLKLGAAQALLGMPSNRHWVLLANYSDKTMLRNEIVFELSRLMGFAWTPRSRFVEVLLNDEYLGIYQLVEHVRIGTDRVNIPTLKVSDTSAVNITGGYLLEVDERRGETFCWNSTMTKMVWCANDPETLLDPGWEKQRAYLTNYIAKVDTAIMGPRFTDPDVGYRNYIDVESAVNYYLLQEAVKNVDGDLRFGQYFYKPRGGKLVFGPVWDFDLAIGNVNYYGADVTSGWYARNAQWFTRLFQDPVFKARVQARWGELQAAGVLDSVQRLAPSRGNYLSIVQAKNFTRWPILATWVWPNRVVTGTYDKELMALSGWFGVRLDWVTQNIMR